MKSAVSIVMGRDCVYLRQNDAHRALFEGHRLIGTSAFNYCPPVVEHYRDAVFATGKAIELPPIELDIAARGKVLTKTIESRFSPLFDDDGKVEGMVCVSAELLCAAAAADDPSLDKLISYLESQADRPEIRPGSGPSQVDLMARHRAAAARSLLSILRPRARLRPAQGRADQTPLSSRPLGSDGRRVH